MNLHETIMKMFTQAEQDQLSWEAYYAVEREDDSTFVEFIKDMVMELYPYLKEFCDKYQLEDEIEYEKYVLNDPTLLRGNELVEEEFRQWLMCQWRKV